MALNRENLKVYQRMLPFNVKAVIRSLDGRHRCKGFPS